jgi:hypothetical protein
LLVVLYGCENSSLTLNEEHGLRVFENRVLRTVFGPKRDEIIGGSRKLHNEELHNFYSSSNIIRIIKSRRMKWARHVPPMRRRGMHIGFWWEDQKKRDHYKDLDVGGRIISKCIIEIGWGSMDRIRLAQDRYQSFETTCSQLFSKDFFNQ